MQPWYNVISPRKDLREQRPLDASEFAVHLDHVRDGRAPSVYQNPEEFFNRTYLTDNMLVLASQVTRRLSGNTVEASAVFNLSTQFGGGKTHSLTMLYHLAGGATGKQSWAGCDKILSTAQETDFPEANCAVFVGTEFDSISGRGGSDGSPHRKTPWGEIAFQLGGAAAFSEVAQHDAELVAPGGDVIERMLPEDRPCLILLDELMNYVSRSRKSGLSAQLYNFLHNLSEVARGRTNVVLVASIPASELEMTAEDQSDYERLKKLLDRLGKPLVMSAEKETSEIIRRRLFEWNGLPPEAEETISQYATWVRKNKDQLPNWFSSDKAREAFANSYPLHPSILTVFERKWQGLPRFQQTRGILRLLALWVANAYNRGFKDRAPDPLIDLGSAPVDDPLFRAAMFEQLGEQRLETAVTSDIAGRQDSHAVRLDKEAQPDIKENRLHQKTATVILFESNGGQQRGDATLPEIRLAVGKPGLSLGLVEQCLESLADVCYYLGSEFNRYRFSLQPNLNKLLADRRASISALAIRDRVRAEIQRVIAAGPKLERVYFPEQTSDVPDRPALTFVVLPPQLGVSEPSTIQLVQKIQNEVASSGRVYKSALIWVGTDSETALLEEARKLLAWREIESESFDLKLDDVRTGQLRQNIQRAEKDLAEAVWRSYKNILYLNETNEITKVDLGLITSSSASSYSEFVLNRLKLEELVVDSVSPNLLTRLWPPALPIWSTQAVRDAFFSSPQFPRLLTGAVITDTIVAGVERGLFGYAVMDKAKQLGSVRIREQMLQSEVDIDQYAVIIQASELSRRGAPGAEPEETVADLESGDTNGLPIDTGSPVSGLPTGGDGAPSVEPAKTGKVVWEGALAPSQWMQFYTRVISRYASTSGISLRVRIETGDCNDPSHESDRIGTALGELGLTGQPTIEPN